MFSLLSTISSPIFERPDLQKPEVIFILPPAVIVTLLEAQNLPLVLEREPWGYFLSSL